MERQEMGYVIVGLLVLVVLLLLTKGFFIIEQQRVGVVERFGRFLRLAGPGLHFKFPYVDRIAARVNLQVEQMIIKIETKTKDNVFVTVEVAVQYKVDATRVQDAYYLLDDPALQMEAFTSDVVRSNLPGLDLDTAYADVEQMALAIEKTLRTRMQEYGYTIVKALVLNLNPATEVKEAMNRINAARRNQEAANAQGEADKILVIKRAEAESESKRLQGEGIAAQRRAIVDGLRESVERFTEATGVNANEAMELVMLTGYTDMLRDVASASETNTLLLPHSPAGMTDVLTALKASEVSSLGKNKKA